MLKYRDVSAPLH
jgi:hypothetical protein